MFDEFAPVGGCNTAPDLADEPLVIAHEPFNGLEDQGFAILPLFRRDSIQLAFEFGGEMDLHEAILADCGMDCGVKNDSH